MADQLLFDRLAYVDRLIRAGIPADQARAYGDAMHAALRESVATKADVTAVKADIAAVKHHIELAVRDLTIRMGAMLIALFAALVSIKFLG